MTSGVPLEVIATQPVPPITTLKSPWWPTPAAPWTIAMSHWRVDSIASTLLPLRVMPSFCRYRSCTSFDMYAK